MNNKIKAYALIFILSEVEPSVMKSHLSEADVYLNSNAVIYNGIAIAN